MAGKKCTACGKAEKYMNARIGLCSDCGKTQPRTCVGCGEVKPASEFFNDSRKKTGKASRCKKCLGYKMTRRVGWRKRRNRLLDSWYDARSRGSDITLEEYADQYERAHMGCKPSDWLAWASAPTRAPPIPKERDALRAKADRLQRPVRDPYGRRVWPSGWSGALRFSWRYENDDEFRIKQIERTKLRKYTMPSYGASSERAAGSKRKWQRAVDQMGSVTRAHIRREMRARVCSYCLEPLTADNRHLDHVHPLCGGGAHDDGNIIACCSSCNTSKGRKSLVGWLLAAAG